MVDIFADENKTVIYNAPNREIDSDEKTRLISFDFLNVFIAKEDEKNAVCYLKQKKEYLLVEKESFFPSTL